MDNQEERVERMIVEGRRVLSAAIETYRPVAIVAAYSGGDDSIVSTHFTMTERPDAVVFNADTLIGLEPTRTHIERTCQRFRWGLEVGKATAVGCPEKRRIPGVGMIPFDPTRDLEAGEWRDGATAYEERALNFGFPGRSKAQHAIMYQRLKEKPIRRFLKTLGARQAKDAPKVLLVSGIRKDESAIRAGYNRDTAEGAFGDVWVNPFYWTTATDFAAYRDEFGLPANPVKRTCGISGECACLTFARDTSGITDRAAIEAADPAFGQYVNALETRVMEVFPWGYGQSPPPWWVQFRKDAKNGQLHLFDDLYEPSTFQPMCVGCHRGK